MVGNDPVMVVTHEFGHLFGSRHTHACVWNGDNTAIDGCAGYTEGSCSLPGNPPQGGTIMSYCHQQSVGINFALGFGLQPGNVIRNSVINGNCLDCCAAGQDNLSITENISGGSHAFGANTTITATNIISGDAEVTYKAGEEVKLLPGFWAKAGVDFHAYIDGCGGSGLRIDPSGDINEIAEYAPSLLQERNRESTKTMPVLNIYPNPFLNNTIIKYTITNDLTPVSIIIFNTVGKKIAIPLDRVEKPTGTYKVVFDGSQLPAGIYYCRLRAGDHIETRKMILAK